MAIAALLAGCGQKVLDFRNAAISGGKVYAAGSNKPFTGTLTNVPLAKLPASPIYKVIGLVAKTTGNQDLSGIALVGGMGALMGTGGGMSCDVQVKKGGVDGDASCKAGTTTVLEFGFKNGAVHGKVSVFDPAKGARVGEANFDNGQLDGPSKALSTSGVVRHTATWKAGVAHGREELFDEQGRIKFRGDIVEGKYEGEAVEFNPDGKVAQKTRYVNGEPQQNASRREQPSGSKPEVEACVDKWMAAYLAEKGQDAPIRADQSEEWRSDCLKGRQPS